MSFLERDVAFVVFKFDFFFFSALWAPQAECHLVPLYSLTDEADVFTADTSKTQQLTTKNSRWMDRKKYLFLIYLYVFVFFLTLICSSLPHLLSFAFPLQRCSRCAAWSCFPSSSLRRSAWECTTSLTGATAWPGDPPSSHSGEPSSTASTPRTTKTTTKVRTTRAETETLFHPASSRW